ncbi:hypothetical protein M514_28548, partial [Trichuris suis]
VTNLHTTDVSCQRRRGSTSVCACSNLLSGWVLSDHHGPLLHFNGEMLAIGRSVKWMNRCTRTMATHCRNQTRRRQPRDRRIWECEAQVDERVNGILR